MSRPDTQITVSIAVKPAQFLDSIRADGQCTVSSTTAAPAPGTWSLYLVGRKYGESLDPRLAPHASEREICTGISVKAFLTLEPPGGEHWLSKDIFMEFQPRGAAPSRNIIVTPPGRDLNANSHVHSANSGTDANGPLPSAREVYGDLLTPLLEFSSVRIPLIIKCTAVIRPREPVEGGLASTVRVLSMIYVNAQCPERPPPPPGPAADSPVARDHLSLFDGVPFQYDPFTDSEVHFGDKIYHCHRSVLKSAGSVFKAQLTAPLEGGRPNVFNVDLPTIELEEAAVDAFMMALYRTQSLYGVDSAQHLIQLYHLMDYYGADRAAAICAERLSGMVSTETAKDLLVFANSFNLQPLLDSCLQHCASLDPTAWAEGDWAALSREQPDLMPRIFSQMAQNRDRDQRRIQTLERNRDSFWPDLSTMRRSSGFRLRLAERSAESARRSAEETSRNLREQMRALSDRERELMQNRNRAQQMQRDRDRVVQDMRDRARQLAREIGRVRAREDVNDRPQEAVQEARRYALLRDALPQQAYGDALAALQRDAPERAERGEQAEGADPPAPPAADNAERPQQRRAVRFAPGAAVDAVSSDDEPGPARPRAQPAGRDPDAGPSRQRQDRRSSSSDSDSSNGGVIQLS